MARGNFLLHALNRGEVSKIALARVDLERLRLAAACQVNWLPFVLGPMMLRPGLGHVGETYTDAPSQLVDFVFSATDTALIELTDSRMRVRINDVLVSRVAVATAVGDPNMTGAGALWDTSDTTAACTTAVTAGVMTLTAAARGGLARAKQTITVAGGDQNKEHGLRFTVTRGPVTVRAGSAAGLADYIGATVLDTGTHALSFTPTGASVYLQIESTDIRSKTLTQVTIDAAGVLSLPTPWLAADLSTLRWTASGDIIYVAAYGKQQYKIERRGTRPYATGWSVVKYRSDNGPFQSVPGANITLTPSGGYGNVTLTASRSYFTANHVDALFRLFSPGQVNQALLGAANAATEPLRVAGIGVNRKFAWAVSGTFVGTLTLEFSAEGPNSGFAPAATQTAPGSYDQDDGSAFNNVVLWYRVRFRPGDYTSGAAVVSFGPHSSGVNTPASAGGRYGICRVTGYTSPTVVNIEVLSDFSSLTPANDWVEADWSPSVGWPTSVAFVEGRLGWFGRDRMWCSQSNNYVGFAEIDNFGNTLGDAGVIIESFGEGPVDSVNWALALSRLLCGREEAIASVRSSNFDTPLTPTNFSIKDCSEQGAARLPAVKFGKRGVFVQQSGAKLYEILFDAQQMDYDTRDLTRLNLDIGKRGFVDIAGSIQPDKTVWLPRGDGQVACLLYDPADEVEAWWRLMTLGVVERVRRLPNPSGRDDLVYMVVKRTVHGVTRRFIEKLAQRENCVGGLSNHQLDSYLTATGSGLTSITLAHLPATPVTIWADGENLGQVTTTLAGIATLPNGATADNIVAGLGGATVTYDGAATTQLTGLSAYEGLPAEVFADQQPADGMDHVGPLTVSGGVITLPNGWEASKIVAFFGYTAPFMSAKLAYGAQLGTAVAQKKRIDHLGLELFDADSQSLTQGQRFDIMDALPQIEAGAEVPAGTIWSEYDAQMMEAPGGWDTDARLCLLAQAPNPVKVGGVVIGMATNG